jgi:hypothetical protein
MRRTTGGLCLLMTLAVALLAAPLVADESAAPKRAVIASKYDVSKEITVEGTVKSLVTKPVPGTLMGAHLMVSTAQGTVDAHIGDYVVTGRYPTSFASGQAVKLVGMMAEFNHQNVLLVRTIQTGNRTITVRSEHGFLSYHLTRASLTGGAR